MLVILSGADFAYAAISESGPPLMPQTFYGNVYVDDMLLIEGDSGYTLSLEVENRTLATYTMGDYPEMGDYYILEVPLNSDCSVTDAACIGDEAYIYINGEPINENPVPITDSGAWTRLDISTGMYISLEIYSADIEIVGGSTDYATARATPEGLHELEIEDLICKDTDRDYICDSYIGNPSEEISVVFTDTGALTATTDSSGEAAIAITLNPTATHGARYVYRVRTVDGGWKEAEATASATAIPEFPSAALPAMISMIAYGLMRRRMS